MTKNSQVPPSKVDPAISYETVFAFPIHNALAEGRTEYDATRSWWTVSRRFRICNDALAVGLSRGLSRGVFSIATWTEAPAAGKWEFIGKQIPNHELDGKNWQTVIHGARGFFGFGNYLVVKFDGRGHYCFIRGSADKSSWRPL